MLSSNPKSSPRLCKPKHLFALIGVTIVPIFSPALWAAPVTTQPLQKQATTSVPVSGVVLGPDDKPIIGAQVAFKIFNMVGRGFDIQIVLTDGQGRFSNKLEIPTSLVKQWEANGGVRGGQAIISAPNLAVTEIGIRSGENVIRLEAARSVSGTVVDEAGKPLSGVKVGLRGIAQNEEFRFVSLDSAGDLEEQFSTKSGADGRWTIGGLPKSGNASFALRDPSYSVYTLRNIGLDIVDSQVKPMVAKAGGHVTGRVLIGDKPLVGATVVVGRTGEGSQGYGTGIIDKDGSYLISGLDDSTYRITASEKTGEWLAAGITGVKTKVGETTQVSDLVMGHGFLMEGTYVDSDTGLPLQYAQVGAQGPHGSTFSTPSDEKGRYLIRLVPGETRFYLYATPYGYLRDSGADFKTEVSEAQKTLPPLKIKKGEVLTGTAVDEAGKVATGAIIMIGSPWDGTQAIVDADGNWKMVGVRVEYNRRNQPVGDLPLSVRGEWQIVSPKKVPASLKEPIPIVLRHASLATLNGRVLTDDGKPIKDVTLQLEISVANGGSYQSTSSDAEGRFKVTKLRPENKVKVTAIKDGYSFVSGGRSLGAGMI